MVIYLICNEGKPISMIKSGQEPEDFLKRVGNEKTVITLTQEDVRDIIRLNKRG